MVEYTVERGIYGGIYGGAWNIRWNIRWNVEYTVEGGIYGGIKMEYTVERGIYGGSYSGTYWILQWIQTIGSIRQPRTFYSPFPLHAPSPPFALGGAGEGELEGGLRGVGIKDHTEAY